MIKKVFRSLLVLGSLNNCVIDINNDNIPENDISRNDSPSDITENDPSIDDNLALFPDPDIDGLGNYGALVFGSDPNNPDSVYNNLIDGISLEDLRLNSQQYQDSGFWYDYRDDINLKNAVYKTLKPNLESLASELSINSNEELLVQLSDYVISSLFNNTGYDAKLTFFAENNDNKYMIFITNNLNANNYTKAFVFENADIVYDYVNDLLNSRYGDAF